MLIGSRVQTVGRGECRVLCDGALGDSFSSCCRSLSKIPPLLPALHGGALVSEIFSLFFSPLFEGRRRKVTRKNHDWSKTSSCLRVVKKISTRSGTTAQRPSEVKFSIGARAGSLSTASLVFLLPPSSQGKIQTWQWGFHCCQKPPLSSYTIIIATIRITQYKPQRRSERINWTR